MGGERAVISTDTMVENEHFRLDWVTPADVGHRALACALSDLAAMGADAGEAYVALGVGGGAGLRGGARADARRPGARRLRGR